MKNKFDIQILTSNADTLKDRGLQFKEAEITLIVFNKDIMKDDPKIWAFRYGMIYDPHNEFKPDVARNNRLPQEHIDDYFALLPAARERLKEIKDTYYVRNSPNTFEIEELKGVVERQKIRIQEQSAKISELSNSANNNNNSQTDRLEALIEMQAAALKQINDMKPREIIIKDGDKKRVIKANAVHEKFSKVLNLVKRNTPVYLNGPAGTGKSELVRQVAESLGLQFYPVSTVTEEFKLSGFLDMKNEYKPTMFYKAFKFGGIFFLDEMDSATPEVLLLINSAIANKYFDFPGEFVEAHPDFRIVAAGNTAGRGADNVYTGRFQLDGSTLDRYRSVKIDYSPAIENAICGENNEFLSFVHSLREASKETDIHIIVSYRSMGRVLEAEEFEEDEPLHDILDECLIKGMASDDIQMLADNMRIPSNNKYYKALKRIS